MTETAWVVGVDVGTGSARAGVFDLTGTLLARAEHPIVLHRPIADHAEYESQAIWHAACLAVRGAIAQTDVAPRRIAGISFDATCSLVVRDADGEPVSVSTTGEQRWDTIAWLDHRAVAEADECTATGHDVLEFAGGLMSPEMQIPKLMWLKRHLPSAWRRGRQLFDLADFLTWKASGSPARSQCTLTCKWNYLAHEAEPWRRDFLETVGLGELIERMPQRASPIGTNLGTLTPQAADELGLTPSCRVGAGIIDAHAGALALLGPYGLGEGETLRHAALIGGTSTCIMALSQAPLKVPGLWGPYSGAVLPNLWLSEGGQSATGALLDCIVRGHGAGGEPTAERHRAIIARILELRGIEGEGFAHRLHVLPDFHGNRSPLADPHSLGVISGLTLDTSFDSLCRLYWRTAVALAFGVRHIVETLNQRGYAIDTLHVTGGHLKNPLLLELYADATGLTVTESGAEDAVLLGTAMIAATAAGLFSDLHAAAIAMNRSGSPRAPRPQSRAAHDRDYERFLMMHAHRAALDRI